MNVEFQIILDSPVFFRGKVVVVLRALYQSLDARFQSSNDRHDNYSDATGTGFRKRDPGMAVTSQDSTQ